MLMDVATECLGDLVELFLLRASTAQLCVIDSDSSRNCGMLRYLDVYVSCYLGFSAKAALLWSSGLAGVERVALRAIA